MLNKTQDNLYFRFTLLQFWLKSNHCAGRSTCASAVTRSLIPKIFVEQDRHCTYNVTKRRVRVTIIATEQQRVVHTLVCVCSLSYPPCKVHVPYYTIICGLSGSTTFFHAISKQHDLREKKS